MKFTKRLILILALFISSVSITKAETILPETDSEEVVAQTTKYYKTVTALSGSTLMRKANLGEVNSFTTEISEEEYNSISPNTDIMPYAQTVETNYKKLTATISKYNSNYFKYSGDLTWKTMPSTRSYDIMGLGYFANVKLVGQVDFTLKYCTTDGLCNTNFSYYVYSGNNGVGAMFALPGGSLSSLSQSMYILVEKSNPNTTVFEQELDADYSHATKTISYSLAKQFTVDTGGIKLTDAYSYYDSIEAARVRWTGTW